MSDFIGYFGIFMVSLAIGIYLGQRTANNREDDES